MEVESDNEDGKRKCPGAHVEVASEDKEQTTPGLSDNEVPLMYPNCIGLQRGGAKAGMKAAILASYTEAQRTQLDRDEKLKRVFDRHLQDMPGGATACAKRWNDRFRGTPIVASQAARKTTWPLFDDRVKAIQAEIAELERTKQRQVDDGLQCEALAGQLVAAFTLAANIAQRHANAFKAGDAARCTQLGAKVFADENLLQPDADDLQSIKKLSSSVWCWMCLQLLCRGAAADPLCAALGRDVSKRTLLYEFMELCAGSWTTLLDAVEVTKTKNPSRQYHDALRTAYRDVEAQRVHEDTPQTQIIDVLPPLPTCIDTVSPDCQSEQPGMPNASKIWALAVPESMQEAFAAAAKGMLDEVMRVRTMRCESRVRVLVVCSPARMCLHAPSAVEPALTLCATGSDRTSLRPP